MWLHRRTIIIVLVVCQYYGFYKLRCSVYYQYLSTLLDLDEIAICVCSVSGCNCIARLLFDSSHFIVLKIIKTSRKIQPNLLLVQNIHKNLGHLSALNLTRHLAIPIEIRVSHQSRPLDVARRWSLIELQQLSTAQYR